MEHSKVVLELDWLAKKLQEMDNMLPDDPGEAGVVLQEIRAAVDLYNTARVRQREVVEQSQESLADAVTIIMVKVVRDGNGIGVIHAVPAGMYTMREVGRAFGLMHSNSAEYARMLIGRFRSVSPEAGKAVSAGYIEGVLAGNGPSKEGGCDGFSMIG